MKKILLITFVLLGTVSSYAGLNYNSKIAKMILSKWSKEKNNFIKVMPKEYKIALERIAQEKINELIK